jgi:hypothetical protein
MEFADLQSQLQDFQDFQAQVALPTSRLPRTSPSLVCMCACCSTRVFKAQLQVFRQRIMQLETINVELEHRLEKQAKERMEVCWWRPDREASANMVFVPQLVAGRT